MDFFASTIAALFIFANIQQGIKADFGGQCCSSFYGPSSFGSFGGPLLSYGLPSCGPAFLPTPIPSLVQVPQPQSPSPPIPAPLPSVTIPNIILALLPPTSKLPAPTPAPARAPLPAPSGGIGPVFPQSGYGCGYYNPCQAQPLVIPVPQPVPFVVPEPAPCPQPIAPSKPSVTIPNIIAALLPPTSSCKPCGCR